MITIFYLLVFLIVVFIYIHLVDYYNVNNDIDYIELYEPLKVDYEKVCQQKIPFSVLFENASKLAEAKTQLQPPLLYNISKSSMHIDYTNDDVICDNSSRNIIFVPEDVSIDVKLFPPKSKDVLDKLKTSVWTTNFLDNVKHLKISVSSNSALVIPTFWYYSIRYKERSDEKKSNNDNIEETKSNPSSVTIEKYNFNTYANYAALTLSKTKDYILGLLNN